MCLPAGVLLLDGATVQLRVAQKIKDKPEVIVVQTRSDRTFYFLGPNAYENSSWIEALRSVPGILIVTSANTSGPAYALSHAVSFFGDASA